MAENGEGGEGIGRSEKEEIKPDLNRGESTTPHPRKEKNKRRFELSHRKSRETTSYRPSISNPVIQNLYDKATEQQGEYVGNGISDIEGFLSSPEIQAVSEINAEIRVLQNKNWPNRNEAMIAVISERRDNPMDANFNDVVKILEGQIKDVSIKFKNKKEIKNIRRMQKIAETMQKGGKIKNEDAPQAYALNDYLRAMFEDIENERYNLEKHDQEVDLAEVNKAVAIFERLFQISNDYPVNDSEEISKDKKKKNKN